MVGNGLSPGGTAESCLTVHSSLRDYVPVRRRYPGDKSLGYFHAPLRGISTDVGNSKLKSCGTLTPRLRVDKAPGLGI